MGEGVGPGGYKCEGRRRQHVDEAGYAEIVRQVRTAEFDHELHERLKLAAAEKANAVELAEARAEGQLQKAAAAKDA